jgi:beta-1,4-N-acetylglucosaminyltransferase
MSNLCFCISVLLWMLVILIKKKPAKAMIVLGSGGHTMEMLKMLHEMDHVPVYVMAESDLSSQHKIKQVDLLERIPRSRYVHQSWWTTPFTTAYALFFCMKLIWKHHPKVLVCNGPGTCVPLCLVAFIFRFVFMFQTRIVFIESFARVTSLSLSGKILYHISDRFLVQWPDLLPGYPRAEFHGRLV